MGWAVNRLICWCCTLLQQAEDGRSLRNLIPENRFIASSRKAHNSQLLDPRNSNQSYGLHGSPAICPMVTVDYTINSCSFLLSAVHWLVCSVISVCIYCAWSTSTWPDGSQYTCLVCNTVLM